MFSFHSSRMVPQFFVPYHINFQRGQSVSLQKVPPFGCCQIVSSWFHFTCFSFIKVGVRAHSICSGQEYVTDFFKILFSDNETNLKSLWTNLKTERSKDSPQSYYPKINIFQCISCQPFVLCMGRKRNKGRKYIIFFLRT